jgi:MYXO-CTERM domain-containing protein
VPAGGRSVNERTKPSHGCWRLFLRWVRRDFGYRYAVSTVKMRSGFVALLLLVCILLARPAEAAVGSWKFTKNDVQEVSGAWHIYVTIDLGKAPLTAHQPMKFVFTKTMVYERSLVDGQKDPVINRQVLQNQTPTVESLDVDFADPSGKIFKATRFDFGLTRARGYEAGEYKVELRTADGTNIGSPSNLILKGDNPVVDRRAMAFNAEKKGMKKVEGYDAGAKQAKNDDQPAPTNNTGPAEVTPMGTATGFVPKEGMQETEEEKIKSRPPGCGCEIPGHGGPGTALFFLAPVLGIGLVALRRRRSGAPEGGR